MNQRLGMAEFFAMEAAEYLDRLDVLVSAASAPDPDEFQRLARALRGAALMANQQPIAAASGAFEHLARAVRDGSRPWDEACRQVAVRAVDDLRVLIRRVREWNDDDTARAHDLANALQGLSGRPSAPHRRTPTGPDPGTRAFVGREGASLASALDRAAKVLRQQPDAAEPLQAVLNVMQPLRGLATLSDLPPMAELLDSIEAIIAETAHGHHPGAQVADVFASAARALSTVTRQVSGEGGANPDGDDVRDLGSRLTQFLGLDQPVRPIETLYYDDAGPHIVEQGTPPPRQPIDQVELVSHGERLRQIADALDGATSPTIREFRSHGLAGTFRALDAAVGTALGDATAAFAHAAWAAVAAGRAVSDASAFAAVLREAGSVLSTAAETTADAVADRLRHLAAQLGAAAPATASSPEPTPEPEPAREAAPAAPIPPTMEVPAAAASVGDTPGAPERDVTSLEAPGLAGSFQRYHRFVTTLGLGTPSLDELLAGPPADPAVSAPPPPAPVAAAAPTEPVGADAEAAVPITALEYSPEDALQRALSLRDQVREAVARGAPEAADLVEEIFDLVRIGLPDNG